MTRGASRGRTSARATTSVTSRIVKGSRSRSLRSIRSSSRSSASTGSAEGTARKRPFATSVTETSPSIRVESDVSRPVEPSSAIG
jgi:hypothetical protein